MAIIDGTPGNDSLVGTPDADAISGYAGDDFIRGEGGDDDLDGGDGNDVIRGGPGDDVISGGPGDDHMRGNEGVDYFDGGGESGLLNLTTEYGDRVSFADFRATQGVVADLRTGIISNDGFGNVETMVGIESLGGDTAYADIFYGNDSTNALLGSRDDSLYGFGGDDFLYVSSAAAVVDGGDGVDTLRLGGFPWLLPDSDSDGIAEDAPEATAGWYVNLDGGAMVDGYGYSGAVVGIENVTGTAFDDQLLGDDGANVLAGGDGHDYIRARGGDDSLSGGNGDDYLGGGFGNDILDGGAGWDRVAFFHDATAGVTVDLNIQGVAQDTGQGMDTLVGIEHASGTTFADVLTGNGGDNWLWGEGGNDSFAAGAGNDLVEAGPGTVTADGGTGTDSFSLWDNNAALAGVAVSLLLQGGAQATGIGSMTLTGFENLSGSNGNDALTGDSASNILAGDQGNDTLSGGDGDDLLLGDGRIIVDTHGVGTSGPITTYEDVAAALPPAADGNDTLTGGKGNDTLVGGGGDDVLTGGAGTDRFVFGPASGHDRITDFAKKDVIVLQHIAGVDDFGDLSLTASGKDTLVGWGTGDWILIEGVKPKQLSAADFEFAPAFAAAAAGAPHGPGLGFGSSPDFWMG